TNQSALTLGAPIAGGGQFQSTGGTLTLASAIAQPVGFALTSTTVQGTGSLTLQGAVNSMNGVALNAPVTVASGKALSLTNTTISRALTNDGTVTMSGSQTVTLGVGGSVLNRGEWSMGATGGQNCILSSNGSSSATVTFTNQGTLRATGAGVKFLNSNVAPLALTSTGSVLAEAGQLQLNCSISNLASNRLAGGVWDTSADLRLPQAIRTIAADVTLRGSGNIRSIDGNTLQLATLSRIEPGARGRFIDTGTRAITPFGGTLLNEGTLALDGSSSLNISGAFACSPSSVITRLASAANTAINAATGTINGSFAMSFDPSFAPSTGSTWTLASFPSGRSHDREGSPRRGPRVRRPRGREGGQRGRADQRHLHRNQRRHRRCGRAVDFARRPRGVDDQSDRDQHRGNLGGEVGPRSEGLRRAHRERHRAVLLGHARAAPLARRERRDRRDLDGDRR
ncbi:MAG: hypothetical protein NTU45_05420, partial [Planctomycetota bacterium]|nr:hypothetical protein [Planctomycetota bacterium]